MRPILASFFAAVRKACTDMPSLYSRLRLHFVGTSYSTGEYTVLPIAREQGVEAVVHEHPHRVPYLDALQLLSDSHALLIIGSEEPHYTPSKVFPYVLSRKPLLTVFHRDSNVIQILKEIQQNNVVTFSTEEPLSRKTAEVALRLRQLIELPAGYEPPICWQAFEKYTTRAMTARLAEVFDKAVLRS